MTNGEVLLCLSSLQRVVAKEIASLAYGYHNPKFVAAQNSDLSTRECLESIEKAAEFLREHYAEQREVKP